jgi:peptidoglycan hydrolase-like protein with peptidoglycan-binding domain
MCLVEIPASYQTVRRQVLVKSAGTRVIEIPAEYQTVKVTKMVSPPQEKRIPIPEEYETVTRTEKISEGYMEWKRVLCETNLTPDMVSKIQSALMQAGYNPGPIDGVMGSQTHTAIKSYQKQKGFAEGDLTYETIESLGIKIN